jgi:cytoskeletal protein RodZ
MANGDKEIRGTEERPVAPKDLVGTSAAKESLGRVLASAREGRGYSQDEVSRAAQIPIYYLRMIESDDYASISDQLYLLPFLRRYASHVGLDPEDAASRFIRDVQRADLSSPRSLDPIEMRPARRSRTAPRQQRRIAVQAAVVIVPFLLGFVVYWLAFASHR